MGLLPAFRGGGEAREQRAVRRQVVEVGGHADLRGVHPRRRHPFGGPVHVGPAPGPRRGDEATPDPELGIGQGSVPGPARRPGPTGGHQVNGVGDAESMSSVVGAGADEAGAQAAP